MIRNSPVLEDYSMDSAISWRRLTDGKRGSPTMPPGPNRESCSYSPEWLGRLFGASRLAGRGHNGGTVRPNGAMLPSRRAKCEAVGWGAGDGGLAMMSWGASACELAQSRCATCYGN